MKSIVETVELQHRAVEREVAALEAALQEKAPAALRGSLDRLEVMLTAHVKLEHDELYPALLARAEGDAAHETVRLFQENLVRIGEGLLGFFKRWRGDLDAQRIEALGADGAGVLRLLQGRLRDEERVLHPIFRRLIPS